MRSRLLEQLLATLPLPPPLSPASGEAPSGSLEDLAPPVFPPATLSALPPLLDGAYLPTLRLLKLLGRVAAGSQPLATPRALGCVVHHAGLSRVALLASESPVDSSDPDDQRSEESLDTRTVAVDPLSPAESEALRCLCNTLTLHPAARALLPPLLVQYPTWLEGLVALLDQPGSGFLAARVLFLLTTGGEAGLITSLVQHPRLLPRLTLVRSVLRFIFELGEGGPSKLTRASKLVCGAPGRAASLSRRHHPAPRSGTCPLSQRHAARAPEMRLQSSAPLCPGGPCAPPAPGRTYLLSPGASS